MNIRIIAVGRIRDKNINGLIEEYSKRLSGYVNFEIIETPEQKFGSDNASKSEIQIALEKEGEDILKKIPPKSRIIALCIEGKSLSSEEFSKYIGQSAIEGFSSIVFIIGSSYGLAKKVKDAAHLQLSFSKMTFPHGLMRAVLCEQIFRAFKILKGEVYHK